MSARAKTESTMWAWAVVVIAAAVYYLTCCRTVFVGDSGELSLILTTGGIAHPPGYPLYTILGYLWLKLFFFLRPAFAANLFSAAIAASSAGLLYLLLRRLGRPHLPPIVSAAAALVYALALPVWHSAIAAEVYTLSGLLFIAALYAVVDYYFRDGSRRLIVAALLSGLVVTHHFSGGVVIASLIAAALFRRDATMSPRTLASAALAFILPLTLYFYLLMRFDPGLPVNWLSERSLTALWRMVGSENYQQYIGLPTLSDIFHFTREVAVKFFFYFGPGLVLLAIPGLVHGFKTDRKLAAILVIPVILNLVQVALYQIPDYDEYLIPSAVVAVVFIALGLSWLYSMRAMPAAASWVIAGILVILPLGGNFSHCNFRSFTLAERYGSDLLDSAPPGAVVMLKSDNAGHTALYLRYAEEYRPDLAVYTLNSTLMRLMDTYRCRNFGEIMDSLYSRTDRVFWGAEYIVNQGMNPSPGEKNLRGMLYGPPQTSDASAIETRIATFVDNSLPDINLRGDLKAQQIYMEYALLAIDRAMIAGQQSETMRRIENLDRWRRKLHDPPTLLAGAQFFRARGMLDESLRWIGYARDAGPSSRESKDIYVNLGAVYRQAGELPAALQALKQALEIDPGYEPARYNFLLVEAESALGRQDWKTALTDFVKLTDLEPDNPLPYYNAAVVCDKMPGRDDDAVKYYRTFLTKAGGRYPQAIRRARERIDSLSFSPGQVK